MKGFGERVDTFFPARMWHHAGRPTTGHCTRTIGINITSPQETDNCTLILDKQKFKASISPKNELGFMIFGPYQNKIAGIIGPPDKNYLFIYVLL